MSAKPDLLKLIALDGDDLAVISAHMQDATVRVADIVVEKGRLLLPMNRFAWESPASRRRFLARHERRNAVLDITNVHAMRARRVNRDDADAVLSVLAVTFEPAPDDAAGDNVLDRVSITFAGGGDIVLDVDGLEARLTDLGGAWATQAKPRHRSV